MADLIMDPDAALENIRAALSKAGDTRQLSDLWTVAEHAEALDGWLSSGGFLPEAWQS